MVVAGTKPGLRERKKQRTRLAIVDAATRLFVEQGYQQTTLAQIADATDVALSTLFNYFPGKVDIVFCVTDLVTESAQRRIVERPCGESAQHAIAAWLSEDLPDLEQPYEDAIWRLPTIISSDPALVAEDRLRLARLEDVLAAGFAGDLGESPDGVRARVLAAIAFRGMMEAWNTWYAKYATDADVDLRAMLEAKAEHVMGLLDSGLAYVETLQIPSGS